MALRDRPEKQAPARPLPAEHPGDFSRPLVSGDPAFWEREHWEQGYAGDGKQSLAPGWQNIGEPGDRAALVGVDAPLPRGSGRLCGSSLGADHASLAPKAADRAQRSRGNHAKDALHTRYAYTSNDHSCST